MTHNEKRMSLILNSTETRGQLWLGNEQAAKDINLLIQQNIKTIISIISKNTLTYPKDSQIEQVVILFIDINHYFSIQFYEAFDHTSQDLQQFFDPSYEAIEKGRLKEAGVLIHCKAGVSRSASLVIAYLMKNKNWGFEKAFFFVKERRYFINPNLGFRQQLVQYNYYLQQQKRQNDILSENSRRTSKTQNSLISIDDSKIEKKKVPESLEQQLEHRLSQTIRQHYVMMVKKNKEKDDYNMIIKSKNQNFDLIEQNQENNMLGLERKKNSVFQLGSQYRKVNYFNVYNNVRREQLSEIHSPVTKINKENYKSSLKKSYNLVNLYNFKV